MNEFVILKAKTYMLEHPEQYYQHSWDCGSTACIVGLAGRLLNKPIPSIFGSKKRFYAALRKVQKLLKLNDGQWERLTQCANWPEPFKSQYGALSRKDPPSKGAGIAAKRIDRFVQTNGRE